MKKQKPLYMLTNSEMILKAPDGNKQSNKVQCPLYKNCLGSHNMEDGTSEEEGGTQFRRLL